MTKIPINMYVRAMELGDACLTKKEKKDAILGGERGELRCRCTN